jgi:hypothetical protein
MEFLDILDVLNETEKVPTAPATLPGTYTFPPTAFAEPREDMPTVKLGKVVGALAVVGDPIERGLWQVVHMPTGLKIVQGTKPNMGKALKQLIALEVDWEAIHLDPAKHHDDFVRAKAIRDEFDQLRTKKER